MYRVGWANGPANTLPGMHRAKQVPGTSIHVCETFLPVMQYYDVRVNHTSDGSPPNMDSWTWYTKWRDVLAANPTYASQIRGIGVDELITNTLNRSALITKMGEVNYWCDQASVKRPDWVLAIVPGNDAALDVIFNDVKNAFPGKVWWFAETYLACYGGTDCGLATCRAMMSRIVAAGIQAQTIYAFNHSHYVPGTPSCSYSNAYGGDLVTRNQAVYDAVKAFCIEVLSHGPPFGWGFWTPSYSSELSRSDYDEILESVE